MAYPGTTSMTAMMADVPRMFRSRGVHRVFIAASVLGLLIGLDTLVLHLRLDPLSDVHAYYDAGARLNAGQPLYVQSASTDDAAFYRYPPLLAIAFRPLALLPFDTAALIWEAFLIVLFVGTLIRLGLRNEWTWIVTGWLAAPIAWSLAIGQAQVAVTFLVALGAPWAIALAGNLKILPVIVALFWIGRRDWRAVGLFAAWMAGLIVLQFVLEPAGTIAFLGFSDLGQVGNVENRSLYALSPVLWGVFVVALLGLARALRADQGRLGAGGQCLGPGQPATADVPAVDHAGRRPSTRRGRDRLVRRRRHPHRADRADRGADMTASAGTRPFRRAIRDGAVIAGLIFLGYLFIVIAPKAGTVGYDAFAYWNVNAADPYQVGVGGLGAFNYTPPIAWLFGPFGALEWPTFLWIWLALLVGNLIWLGGRGVRVLWLLAFPPVALELYHGNIHLWIAAAIVLGFRYPWTWGFVLLTKVTPGIGLLWFAVRREWRALGIALGVTGAIVAISLVMNADLWRQWIAFIASTPEGGSVAQFNIPIPLWIRLPAAAALVAWGGLTDRRWTVPVAATLALPVLWISGFAICAALAAESMWPRKEATQVGAVTGVEQVPAAGADLRVT